MMVIPIVVFLVFLCWGSFLNVIACRLMQGKSSIYGRSKCPCCNHVLIWHDLVPVISWIMLSGKCRYCSKPISWLYPFIELATACSMTLLFFVVPPLYIPSYVTFFSALLVTIRTDFEYMLISQLMSLYLVPIGMILSMVGFLPISIPHSIIGALGGYLCLYLIAYLFTWYTGKEGLGEGDIELMAGIGAFTGPYGCWFSLLIGSIAGSVIGLTYMIFTKQSSSIKIPFGPFLALGAMAYVLFIFL